MGYVPFGSVCALQNGRAFKPSEWAESGTPIVRIQNLNDETKPFNYCEFEVESRFHINSGDLLFSWSGTPGTSFGAFFWNRGRGFLNQHIFRVDVDEAVTDKDFLRHAINSKLSQIIEQAHGGVGLKHITKGKLEAIEIFHPPLEEQTRIAAILDKADTIRRKRQQAIELADQFIRSAFLDIFGDPVTNTKGWELVKLKNIATKIGSGATPRGGKSAYIQEGISLIRSMNIHDDKFVHRDLAHITDVQADLLSNVAVEADDVLLNITGASVCRCAMVDNAILPARVNQHVCIIRPRTEQLTPDYLLHLIISAPFKHQLLNMACGAGATREALTKQQVSDLVIPLPPIELQGKFSLLKRKIQIQVERQMNLLKEPLFESLSQKAFAGEL